MARQSKAKDDSWHLGGLISLALPSKSTYRWTSSYLNAQHATATDLQLSVSLVV